jgi:hypothetical protein
LIPNKDIFIMGGLSYHVRGGIAGLPPLEWPWDDEKDILVILENNRPAVFLITAFGLAAMSARLKGSELCFFDRLGNISYFHRFRWEGKLYEAKWTGNVMVPFLDQDNKQGRGKSGKVKMELFRFEKEVAFGVEHELSDFGLAHHALFKQKELFSSEGI